MASTPIDHHTLRALASLIPSPVLIVELGGPVTFANEAACQLFGRTAAQMVTLVRDDILDTTDPRLADNMRQHRASGTFNGQMRLRDKEGVGFEAEVTSAAISEALIWLAIRHLRVESELREREEELVALNDATAEALVVHQDGIIRATNRAAHELYALPPEGAVGQKILDYVAPEVRDLVSRRIASGSGEAYEAIAMRQDGTRFPVAVQIRTTVFRGRTARLAAIRDLSELRRMQSSLAFADRMASVGALAAGVAHEINNPLTFVGANIDEVARCLASMQVMPRTSLTTMLDMLHDAKVGADRVAAIVRDLRNFSRADDETNGPVDLTAVITYAARMAGAEIRNRAELRLDIRELPFVVGNDTRLGQVFLNLLVNAAHAIPEGAADLNKITVSATLEKGSVVVSVADTGVGIDPAVRQRIFDPFVTTKSQGMGLGLAICYGIVSRLGGEMSVESELGRGATFRVRLPISDEEPRVSAREVVPGRVALQRPRVLIVDDEPMLLRTTARALEDTCDVVTASSAKQALVEIESGRPIDVVFCDLLMPEMTGMALYELLQKAHRPLCSRVVFLTGGVFTSQAEEFLAVTPRPHLDKPFSMDQLQRAVHSVMREPHASRSKFEGRELAKGT